MPEEKTIQVKSDKILGSLYAQVVGVVVTDIDITLEFVYVSPRPDTDRGEVVSRITLPRIVGERMAKRIDELVSEHETKGEKKK
jgi:Protein of unknown function (DUF3467)